MNLPRLSIQWAPPELIKNLIEALRLIEAADKQNLKRGQELELPKGARLIITGDDDARYQIEVVAGVITATAV